jgi:hypothetical protein
MDEIGEEVVVARLGVVSTATGGMARLTVSGRRPPTRHPTFQHLRISLRDTRSRCQLDSAHLLVLAQAEIHHASPVMRSPDTTTNPYNGVLCGVNSIAN